MFYLWLLSRALLVPCFLIEVLRSNARASIRPGPCQFTLPPARGSVPSSFPTVPKLCVKCWWTSSAFRTVMPKTHAMVRLHVAQEVPAFTCQRQIRIIGFTSVPLDGLRGKIRCDNRLKSSETSSGHRSVSMLFWSLARGHHGLSRNRYRSEIRTVAAQPCL